MRRRLSACLSLVRLLLPCLFLGACGIAAAELPPAPANVDGWVEFTHFAYEGRDLLFEKSHIKADEYYNPIISGFHPDPSICRAGDDFYLVHSTFSYFPGVPIFHSRDLVNWQQIGNVLSRPSQLDLDGLPVSSGIFAPAIDYHDGTLYMITTNVRGIGNFYVTATKPAGPWSDPVRLQFDGIDPSFFFDDNGKIYVVHNGNPPDNKPLYDGHRAIWLWEFDPVEKKVLNGRILVNGGVDISKHPSWIEGPHIFKRNGYYYLTCAEGGTGPNHSQVVFRTKSLSEPFVPAPANPILTQRDLDPKRPDPVTALGHASLVEAPNGEWWAVFLGIRPYEGGLSNIGRETFLLPVTWENDWPQILPAGQRLPIAVRRPRLGTGTEGKPTTTGSFSIYTDFTPHSLASGWLFLRTPREQWWSLTAKPGSMLLKPRPVALNSVPRRDTKRNGNPSFIGRRQLHHTYTTTTGLRVSQETMDCEAGLAALQNDANYLFLGISVSKGAAREIFIEQSTKENDSPSRIARAAIPSGTGTIKLRIEQDGRWLKATYNLGDGTAWLTLVDNLDARLLSTQAAGGFVGTVIGMYVRK